MLSKKEIKDKWLSNIPEKPAKNILWISNKITNFIKGIILFSIMYWLFLKIYDKIGIDKVVIILFIIIVLSLNKTGNFWN